MQKMNDVHFKTLDLNLLRVFEALYAERSATLAGARLGLSQSAISHALARLRQSLNDDLFVRSSAGLNPTLRAIELGPSILDAMKTLEQAFESPGFDPARSDRQFVVGATAYTCTVLMPGVMQRFLTAAPHARLRVRGENLTAEELDRGQIDVILGAFEEIPSRLSFQPLFLDTGVWVVREDHPALASGRHAASLADLPQVLIAPDEPSVTTVAARSGQGLKRQRIWSALNRREASGGVSVLTVPDTYSAIAMVRRTSMAALLPRRLVEAMQDSGLVLIDPAEDAPAIPIGAVTRAGEQGPTAWLLGLMRAAAEDL